MRAWIARFLLILPCVAWHAQAATRVEVLETWPAGGEVRLAPGEPFYLRLAYDTDVPAGIWIRPLLHGQVADAGSSPSVRHIGNGEALGWFLLMQAGREADEVSVVAGDGGLGMPVAARVPVHVLADASATRGATAPPWVARLQAAQQAASARAARERESAPPSPGDDALVGGFLLLALALAAGGIAMPVIAMRRWRGGWRLAAAVPIALMAAVMLRIVFDVARDASSHNLWPFEIVEAGAASLALVAATALLRRIAGAGRRAA
jgi:hypothetical protein